MNESTGSLTPSPPSLAPSPGPGLVLTASAPHSPSGGRGRPHTGSRGGRAGQGPGSSLLVPGAPRARGAERNSAARTAAPGAAGTLPGHASPPPQQPDPPGPRSAKSSRPARRPRTHPQGPGPEGEEAAAAPPAWPAAERRSLRGSSPTEAGDAAGPLPLGDSVSPLCHSRPTIPAPARTGAGTAAAKPARRPH